jgi:hypothetical protein
MKSKLSKVKTGQLAMELADAMDVVARAKLRKLGRGRTLAGDKQFSALAEIR